MVLVVVVRRVDTKIYSDDEGDESDEVFGWSGSKSAETREVIYRVRSVAPVAVWRTIKVRDKPTRTQRERVTC